MAIRDFNQGTISGASSIPFYDPANGGDRRASVEDLAEVVRDLNGATDGLQTQYAAPNATGFSVTVAPTTAGASVWLLLTPVAGYAAGTIVLPSAPENGQEVHVSTTQAVTALTVSGGTVNNAPTTLAAGGFFGLRFDGVFGAWFRNR